MDLAGVSLKQRNFNRRIRGPVNARLQETSPTELELAIRELDFVRTENRHAGALSATLMALAATYLALIARVVVGGCEFQHVWLGSRIDGCQTLHGWFYNVVSIPLVGIAGFVVFIFARHSAKRFLRARLGATSICVSRPTSYSRSAHPIPLAVPNEQTGLGRWTKAQPLDGGVVCSHRVGFLGLCRRRIHNPEGRVQHGRSTLLVLVCHLAVDVRG